VIPLDRGDWAATLLPEQGAAISRLTWRGLDLLAPMPAGADPNASFAGAFLMAPWTNRLDGGRLAPGVMLPINRPTDGTAIHGMVRDAPWIVTEATTDRALLVQSGTAGALRWRAWLIVTLGMHGFAITLRLENAGTEACPFGSGWHPFFVCPAGTRLRFGATTRFVHDARMLPVAVTATEGIDGDEAAYAGLDTAFAGWDGTAEIARPDVTLRLQAIGAWSRNLQVFAPQGAGFLCVEPVSHVPDVVNRPEFSAYGAMTLLAPGESLEGSVGIAAR
jgi:aldose 1-epimerase